MRTVARINRTRLRDNFRAVCTTAGTQVAVLPVIKGDGYGHGAVEVARTLAEAGAKQFAVASAEEAFTLRTAGIAEDIVILCGLQPTEEADAAALGLIPMVQTPGQLARWSKQVESSAETLPYHLEIDSGMTRVGFDADRPAKIAAAIKAAEGPRLAGLATHFASAQDFTTPQTEQQLETFRAAIKALAAEGIRPPLIHMANSVALAYRPGLTADMVRPGLALYGYISPPRGKAPAPRLKVRPVLEWCASILSVRDVRAGARLGYDGTYRTSEPMRVGVVSVGYGDGLDRRLSNGGEVLVNRRRCPIVGLVSMDVTLIDLRPAPEAAPGDEVTLIGDGLDAQSMADHCGTIAYEILCRISPRVSRAYV